MAVVSGSARGVFIAGEWRDPPGGRTFGVSDPATGEEIARVADADAALVERAVTAASDAFAGWATTPAEARADLLHRAHHLLVERGEIVARLLTQENGKPLAESRGEVAMSARFLLWHAEEAKRAYGRVVPASARDRRVLVLRQPVGVVAAITPWNFPLSMVARKVAPALAAGCTVILRPAKKTPLVAIELFEIFAEAGVPPGVVGLVTTSDARAFADAILDDRRVRKITFTGSNEVGKTLFERSAVHLKRVSLELGGHAPFLVFEDADLEAAATAAVLSRFRNAGQTCVCTNRLLVQRSVLREITERVTERVARLQVGNGLEEGIDVGPLIDRSALAKVEAHQSDAIARGARVLVGGEPLEGRGYFFAPTVLADVQPGSRLLEEEIFGPVAPVAAFAGEEEALQAANRTDYGLVAYVYTRDLSRALTVCEGLETGMVGLNQGVVSNPAAPFGGVKQSGFGREGGFEGIGEYLETKYVALSL